MKKHILMIVSMLLGVQLCFTAGSLAVFANTTGNNFTMLQSDGEIINGTNDVTFTWDGSKKTSVAASGQTPNATLSSPCPFWGVTWSAHDVAVYGPGTYTVYTGCEPGSPGCGTGAPYTFTVGANELGVHLLWDWNGNNNHDVVNVWQPNAVFGPSSIWTGDCGSNSGSRVWNWMSKDWDSDGVNGAQMIDGPFQGLIVNFNVMTSIQTTGNNFTLSTWNGDAFNGTNDVTFTWDGTRKTSIAASGQTPNATLSSPCPFWGVTWSAHDVAVYGPGTYTVYTGCAPGSPGCGTGAPYTFTVGANELGVHLLWDWASNTDMDVVNVWKPNAVFGPSPMWTGDCGSNSGSRVWNWMSKDWDSDGVNGVQMIDGPFVGWVVNFNVMETQIQGNPCNLPWGGQIANGTSVAADAASSVPCGSSCVSETRTCNNGVLSGSYTYPSCSVAPQNGGWSPISWGACSATCGSGTQTGTRTCTNPAPACGGVNCSGSSTVTQSCTGNTPVNGGWSTWSCGSCSASSCDQTGTYTCTRSCNNPAPACGGSACSGGSSSTYSCSGPPCAWVSTTGAGSYGQSCWNWLQSTGQTFSKTRAYSPLGINQQGYCAYLGSRGCETHYSTYTDSVMYPTSMCGGYGIYTQIVK